MFSRGIDDHSGRGLSMRGVLAGNMWAKIGRVDQTISKLAQNLHLNGSILLDGKEPAADTALVCDDDKFEPIRFEAPQCLRYAGKNLYVLWIGTINAIFHERAVAIDKHGARQGVTHVRCPLGNLR